MSTLKGKYMNAFLFRERHAHTHPKLAFWNIGQYFNWTSSTKEQEISNIIKLKLRLFSSVYKRRQVIEWVG